MAFVSKQMAVCSFRVSSHARKTVEELITELLFADDCALFGHTEEAYSTSSTVSLMHPRTSASSSA